MYIYIYIYIHRHIHLYSAHYVINTGRKSRHLQVPSSPEGRGGWPGTAADPGSTGLQSASDRQMEGVSNRYLIPRSSMYGIFTYI